MFSFTTWRLTFCHALMSRFMSLTASRFTVRVHAFTSAAARASSGGADYAALRVRELKKLLAERSIPAEGLFDKESIVQVRMGSKNGPGRCHGGLPCRLCRLREAGHPEDPAPSAHARPGCRRARSEPHAGGETAPPRAGATTERRSRRAGMRGHPVLAG